MLEKINNKRCLNKIVGGLVEDAVKNGVKGFSYTDKLSLEINFTTNYKEAMIKDKDTIEFSILLGYPDKICLMNGESFSRCYVPIDDEYSKDLKSYGHI